MMRKLLYKLMMFGFSPVRYVDEPPAGDPPAGDPPAGDPPAGDPPAGDPPAGDPPGSKLFGDPPAGDPPAFEPVNYTEVEFDDGFELDQSLVDTYGEDLTAAQITGDQAKVLFPVIKKMRDADAQAQNDGFTKYYEGERAKIDDLPEESQGFAQAAAQKFAGEEGMKALGTFEGDKFWIVELLANVGRAMNDDTFHVGKGAPASDKDATTILFPSMQK